MEGCGRATRWKDKDFCRTPGCYTCRSRYIASQQKAAVDRFGNLDNSDFAFLTIVFSLTADVTEIGPAFSVARRKLRNQIDALRREDDRWNQLQVLGWMEIDALSEDQIPLLGSQRHNLLTGVGLPIFAWDGPVWIVTLHAVVHLRERDLPILERHLSDAWSVTHQIDLQPFNRNRPIAQNLRSTISYALKHTCQSTFFGTVDPWPCRWRAAFYEFLHGWSRGFQSTRVNIGPKGIKRTSNDLITAEEDRHDLDGQYLEPMPVLFT
jgi:hypothetical protein